MKPPSALKCATKRCASHACPRSFCLPFPLLSASLPHCFSLSSFNAFTNGDCSENGPRGSHLFAVRNDSSRARLRMDAVSKTSSQAPETSLPGVEFKHTGVPWDISGQQPAGEVRADPRLEEEWQDCQEGLRHRDGGRHHAYGLSSLFGTGYLRIKLSESLGKTLE
ncbi:hypothetical protein AGOR_G00051010 [Albula goreensis]|uniref:Uncharacterized protein n=1 Tax=Albula goreensis TaxID=1534307 RepID=A0A8T3DTU9_9TELE|nr:hypothetical protein AGOR_G00051010 [Albula goreensis]